MIEVIRELHDTPEFVQRRLLAAGGINRYGEPMYRAVWGWNRLSWIGGKFEDRDSEGNLIREVMELRWAPKYAQVNRWHIEKWMAPEVYGTPATWYHQTLERQGARSMPALGPYPERGEYELAFTLEDAKGGFLQLTATIAEQFAKALEYSRRFSSAKRLAYKKERFAKQEQDYENFAWSVLDDAVPAFHQQPFVTIA